MYKLKAHLERETDHGTTEHFEHIIVADIIESPAFHCGNGKAMFVRIDDSPFMEKFYDIRYDKRYSSADEVGFIEEFMRECWWTGEGWSMRLAKLEEVSE